MAKRFNYQIYRGGEEKSVVMASDYDHVVAENNTLRKALGGLLPKGKGWRDGTMDHMPGVKAARLALKQTERTSGTVTK